MSNSPATPAERPDATLKATPQSQNAQATVDSLQQNEFVREKVRPLLEKDISTFQVGSIKRWLHHYLSRMGAFTPESDAQRPTMEEVEKALAPCLKIIVTAIGRKKNKDMVRDIKADLWSYAVTQNETGRYKYFVKAANLSFKLLHKVQIGSCQPARPLHNPDSVLFMRHDPRTIPSLHKGQQTHIKPDIILAYRKHVEVCYQGSTKDLADDVTRPPSSTLPWAHGLLFVEMKLRMKILNGPPRSYKEAMLNENDKDIADKAEIKEELRKAMGGREEGSGAAASSKPPHKAAKTDENPYLAHSIMVPGQRVSDCPITQLAEYAAEAMFNSFGKAHVLGIMVNGAILNLWHYDHESPLQMIGFDFIQELPHFLLLLYILQRFTPKDWGYLPRFDEFTESLEEEKEDEKLPEMSLTDVWAQVESKVSEATFKGKRAEHAPSRFGINGRSTSVRIGSLSITKDDGKTVIDAAVKLSFRQVGRSQEEAFIKKAHQAFMGKDFPAGGNPLEYLPKIIMSHEYPSFKTDIIRKAVLSNVDDLHHLGTRIPELSVRPAYKPLSSLTEQGDTALLDAFLQLMYCHAMLWSIGIEHGDISPGNLMVNPETGKPKLCDFGLSHFRTETRPKGDSNTATWAFMAIELLTERAMLGEIPRVYRHEVESFVAVLVWIVLRYRKGVLADDSTTKGWTDPSFTKCKDARETTVMRILAGSLPKPSWVSNKIWKVVEDAVSSMERELGRAKTLRAERMLAKGREDAAQIASADEELGRLDGMEFIEKLCAWFLFKGPLGDELAVVLKGQITGPESVAM